MAGIARAILTPTANVGNLRPSTKQVGRALITTYL